MSCFSCFSSKRVSLDYSCDAPRPVRSVSRAEKASVTHMERTVVSEKDIEQREITVTEKEVDVLVSEREYDSEDEEYEAIYADVEKTLEMRSHYVKRGVLPNRKKGKKHQIRIAVHNTGDEMELCEKNEMMTAKIADLNKRDEAREIERRRHQQWEMDRYSS